MQGDKTCPRCGQIIPRGEGDCPYCANPIPLNLRRETTLLLSLIFLGVVFAFTAVIVRAYKRQQLALGGHWYTRGEAAMKAGSPQEALVDFRTALRHSPDNSAYQLRFAQALIDAGKLDEARIYLIRLWQTNPADGQVNLELARVAERRDNVPQVVNYFHNAIDGVWPANDEQQHLTLRERLCRYLIQQNHRPEALAELAALAAQAPNSPRVLTRVGGLSLQVPDYAMALKQFRRSLHLDAKQPLAWEGAGKAAFAQGDYHEARYFLSHASQEGNSEAARLLETTDTILQINPFDTKLPMAVRRRRVQIAFARALDRLQECATTLHVSLTAPTSPSSKQDQPTTTSSPLEKVYAEAVALKPKVTERSLSQNPDLMNSVMNLVFNIEQISAQQCGPPHGMDLALSLLATQNGGSP